jgi:phosphoribosylformylglycinamidine synthase subunit PurL
LAITNCLNFGNPQRPEIMAQITGCLDGMSQACRALDMPIVSGNVSLYNESKATGGGSAILPTPAIGGVGLLDDWETSATIGFKGEELLVLVGKASCHLGQSIWLRECKGLSTGPAPKVDLQAEEANGKFVRELIVQGISSAVHDISDGGLLVAVAEMSLASGIGASIDFELIDWPADGSLEGILFGEEQGRFVVAIPRDFNERLIALAEKHGVPISFMGDTGGDDLNVGDAPGYSGHIANVPLAALRAAHEGFFPTLMGADAALA